MTGLNTHQPRGAAPSPAPAKVLVSGCINGAPIRFNQTNVRVESAIWDRWLVEGRAVAFCAELAAGFPVPRRPAEVVGGSADDVFGNRARVLEDDGNDVTDQFVLGAELALERALEEGCVVAVLTDGSPSCGSSYVYDGSFGGGTHPGRGVVAQLLVDHGIPVFSESELAEADQILRHADALASESS